VAVASLAFVGAEDKVCHAISPTASDTWCNGNCNYVPPNCPSTLCSCDGPGPSPSPGPSPTPSPHDGVLGAYFANWAQYHQAPYKHTAADVAGLKGVADHIYYSFLYFCPPAGSTMPYWGQAPYGSCSDSTEYNLMTLESNDPASIRTLVSTGFKVIASVGGWNFPSHYFSKMVSTQTNRAKFISNAKSFLSSHGFSGIDIDWEFPCSEPRDNAVKITNTKFRHVQDDGGQCPQDTTGLVALLKEMREAMPDMYISVASQAAEKNWLAMGVSAESSQYVDHWHVMNYDYTVSDVPSAQPISPNQPLYNPPAPAQQWSINYTIQGYLAMGVPAKKIMIGLAMYGHTWYKSGMTDWQKFGGDPEKQSKCFGPFKDTYGGAPGKGCSQCGVMMISEIEAAACDNYYDKQTESDIAYCSSAGADGYTDAGVFITYNGVKSNEAIVDYGKSLGVGGFFTFDTSMDSVKEKFKVHKAIAARMAAPSPAPSPRPPTPAPSPVPEPTPAPSPSGTYRCVNGECTSGSGGVDLNTCQALCTPPSTFKCVNNQCVAKAGGVAENICDAVCGSSVV